MKYVLLALMLVAGPAFSQVQIENAWARATPPGAKTGAAYMVIHNKSASPDRLMGAESALAARVETHVHIKEGEVMRMREVKGFDIPANGSFELKPGGPHLMFVDIRKPFKEGEKIPVTLKFAKAGAVPVEFKVGRMGAAAHPMH
ncbi:MAG: copper chaperone PCu(A)C [Betaproteobacteria bacterium]|nr:MAG: copper chaperone PCu(A)C [Betaproteobacteria bacterium]